MTAPSKYVQVYDPKHPLAHKASGQLFVHRQILFNAIGNDGIKCHHCGKDLDWFGTGQDKVYVDHLNNAPTDNTLSNLTASCPSCNQKRAPEWNTARGLDHTAVRVVRHFLAAGKTSAWVARLINVKPTVVGRIKRNETYRRVTSP